MAISSVDVLIVEDSDDDYEATLRALDLEQASDVRISRCADGRQAWDFLLASVEDENRVPKAAHRFVILDLNMPGLDGRHLLSKMKGHDGLRSIPVAILSTSDDPTDVDECYKNGANTYVRKPVNWGTFVKRMEDLKAFWFQTAELPNSR